MFGLLMKCFPVTGAEQVCFCLNSYANLKMTFSNLDPLTHAVNETEICEGNGFPSCKGYFITHVQAETEVAETVLLLAFPTLTLLRSPQTLYFD